MRIRRRPQAQIPISAPDLAIRPAHAHVGASAPFASAGGAVVADGSLLHQDEDLPIQHGGCNVRGPPTPFGAVEGRDLPESPNLQFPLPQSHVAAVEYGKSTTAQTLLLLQGEQDREVMDALRRPWISGGLHRDNSSGAEVSQSIRSVAMESFPVKKRRGTGGCSLVEVEESNGKKPATTEPIGTGMAIARPRTSAATATCMGGNGTCDVKDNGRNHVVEANGRSSNRKSPTVLMEGSRCSRVNGRGWRCCQQTLVGYSLCEHHLGKGRLRSVSSVKGNGKKSGSGNRTKRKKHKEQHQQEPPKVEDGDMEEEELKVVNSIRKRKIGMVKARSISSLLDQTNYATATATTPIPLPAKQEEESPPALHVPSPFDDGATF